MKEGEGKAIDELRAEMLHEQRLANQRLESLENQQVKTNAEIGELRLSVMRLADQIKSVFTPGCSSTHQLIVIFKEYS